MEYFRKAVTGVISRLAGGPHSALEIAWVVMLAISFGAAMYAWIFLSSEAARIPLILFGTVTIAVLVLFTEKGAVVAISILIIGTVVTHEDFIVRLAYMFGSGHGQLRDYLKDEPRRATLLPESTNVIVDDATRQFMPKLRLLLATNLEQSIDTRLAAVSADPGPDQDARRIAEEIVKSLDKPIRTEIAYVIRSVAFRVRARESLERHDYLYKVIKGVTDFEALNKRFGKLERFKFDMAALKNEDLIECHENDWATCKPTAYAARVIEKMGP